MRTNVILIYVGLRTRTGELISQESVREFCARALPNGYNVNFNFGGWQGAEEESALVIIRQAESPHEINQADNTARWFAEHYASRFDQADVYWDCLEARGGSLSPQVHHVRL